MQSVSQQHVSLQPALPASPGQQQVNNSSQPPGGAPAVTCMHVVRCLQWSVHMFDTHAADCDNTADTLQLHAPDAILVTR
jgi:hypothetical protein